MAAPWVEFRRQAPTPELTARWGQEAAGALLHSPADFDAAAGLLCELALLDDPELARGGADGIFRHAVEAMGDAFDPSLSDLYIRFFARVLASSGALDLDEKSLVERAERVRRIRATPESLAPRKILVLSRVTLGADVAVTSVVLRKMMLRFPEAELVLVGSSKAAGLFAGERRVRVRPIDYPRGGGLLERLQAWPAVVEAVGAERGSAEDLIIDPDSRLTQLGMLPVAPDESAYYFFDSRSFSRPGRETLAELTAAWLEEVFGPGGEPLYPWVSLAEHIARPAGARWASVNLGVGDNPRKRLDDPFEHRLLSGLLDAGWRIFLDTGGGGEETARVERLIEGLASDRIVAWRGSIAGFAARIEASDLYLGYDSACQHIAAALGVSTVNIFAGYRSAKMIERWRPVGPGEVRMIVVDEGEPPDRVLARVLEAAR